jgi:hypothetical protein
MTTCLYTMQIPRSELEAARKAMMIVGRLSIVTTAAGAAKAWKDADVQAFVEQHLQLLPEPLRTAVTIAFAVTKLPVQVTDDIILYITGGIHSDVQEASLHISYSHLPASALFSTVSDAAACNKQVLVVLLHIQDPVHHAYWCVCRLQVDPALQRCSASVGHWTLRSQSWHVNTAAHKMSSGQLSLVWRTGSQYGGCFCKQ